MSAEPFAIAYRPTRGEYLHGLTSWVPWSVTLLVLGGIAAVWFVETALHEPSAMHLVRAALLPLAALALELSYRGLLGPTGVELHLDQAGVHTSWGAQDRRMAWPSVRVRETAHAYVFVGRLGAGHVLPRRVLDAPARAAVNAWLDAERVPRLRPAGWILDRVALGVLALLAFVTVYNLFQSSGRRPVAIVAAPTAADVPAAALTMLLHDAGKRVTLEAVQAGTGDRPTLGDLMLVAQDLGAKLWAYRVERPEELRRMPRPFVARMWAAGVYVVVERVDDATVRYIDPALGKRVQTPTAAFFRAFSGMVILDRAPPGR